MQMQQHVKIVAYLYIVFGILGLVAAICMLVGGGMAGLAGSSAASTSEDAAGAMLGGGFMAIISIIIGIMSIPNLLAGWGLLKGKPWARTLTIVLAAISLLSIPIGTIIGAYALWVMLNDETKRMFAGGGSGPISPSGTGYPPV